MRSPKLTIFVICTSWAWPTLGAGLDSSIIRDTAISICDTIKEAEGKKSAVQIEDDIKEELNRLIDRAVDIGYPVNASLTEVFEALVHDTTTTALASDQGCREQLFNKLFDKLIFEFHFTPSSQGLPSVAQGPPRSSTLPSPTPLPPPLTPYPSPSPTSSSSLDLTCTKVVDRSTGNITYACTDKKLGPPVLPISDIDSALANLLEGNIAFDAPDRATIAKSQLVEARLSVTKTPSVLISELTGSGKKESAPLLVGDKMAATLSGGGAFDVSPSGPQVQLISHTYTTIWTWTITPKLAGHQFLNLTFDAILTINGKEGVRTINTLKHKIDVEVAWPETMSEWIDYIKKTGENISWIWATLLIPIGGAIWAWARRKASPPPPSELT